MFGKKMNKSRIEWTTATWNPVTGCTKVSPGCDHCYAETFAERWRGVPGHSYELGFDLQLRPERLEQPLSWKRPSLIFVNSMSDLFHVDVPETYIASVAATMRAASWHTFQVLTKRADRLERLSRRIAWSDNVWLGVSVETDRFYGRVRHLQRVPAAVRFLSCEPLLGPLPDLPLDGVHWVIVGGESGPGARPMDPDWARAIRTQCDGAGVPFFFKQWGAWGPLPSDADGTAVMQRLGKKAAGRLLDGRTWDGMPVSATTNGVVTTINGNHANQTPAFAIA
jgi:protein gp37